MLWGYLKVLALSKLYLIVKQGELFSSEVLFEHVEVSNDSQEYNTDRACRP